MVTENNLPTISYPIIDYYDHIWLEQFFKERYQLYNAVAFFDYEKECIIWEKLSEYTWEYFLKGL